MCRLIQFLALLVSQPGPKSPRQARAAAIGLLGTLQLYLKVNGYDMTGSMSQDLAHWGSCILDNSGT